MKAKKKKKVYDIFPDKRDFGLFKSYKQGQFLLIYFKRTVVLPCGNEVYGNKDRKYFYVVFDFPSKSVGTKLKNRKRK